MPYLSEEIPDWDALTEEEKEQFRQVVQDLGMTLPGDGDDDYFE